MKQRTAENLIAFLSGVLAFVCFYMLIEEAGATSTKPHSQDQGQAQDQSQTATADAASSSVSESVSTSDSASSASNEGNTLEGGDVNVGGDSVENNSSNVVLVPNNNTESCVRVWGIAFGRDSDSAALGIPWRSGSCDFSQAASAADAQGNLELGWYWRCHMKNLYKTFRDSSETKEEAIRECHERMIEPGKKDAIIEELTRKLEVAVDEGARERSRLNKALVDERQKCKEQTDRAVEGCYK